MILSCKNSLTIHKNIVSKTKKLDHIHQIKKIKNKRTSFCVTFWLPLVVPNLSASCLNVSQLASHHIVINNLQRNGNSLWSPLMTNAFSPSSASKSFNVISVLHYITNIKTRNTIICYLKCCSSHPEMFLKLDIMICGQYIIKICIYSYSTLFSVSLKCYSFTK